MQCGEDTGPGIRSAPHIFHKAAVRCFGIIWIFILGLLWKSVDVQPVQKLQIHAQSPEGILRRVNVQIHQARCHQQTRAVQQGKGGILVRKRLKDTGGNAIHTDEKSVLHGLDGLRTAAETEVPSQYKRSRCHGVLLSAEGGRRDIQDKIS